VCKYNIFCLAFDFVSINCEPAKGSPTKMEFPMNLSLDVYKMSYPRQLKKVAKSKEQEINLPQSLLKPGSSILKNTGETGNAETAMHHILPPHSGLYYSSGYMAQKQMINTSSGFNVII
jgi:hypothetical protein